MHQIFKDNLNELSIISKAKIYNSQIENVIADLKQEYYHIFFLIHHSQIKHLLTSLI